MSSIEILKRRQFVATASSSPFWALINLSSFILCFVEFKCALVSSYFIFENIFTIIELGLMLLFLINFVYNLYIYVWIKKFMLPIELSQNEFLLYGISTNEIGFKIKMDDAKVLDSSIKKTTSFPSTPPFELNSSSIIDKHLSLDSTSLSTRLFDSSLDSTSASWSYMRPNSDSFSKIHNSSNKFNNSGSELKFRKSNSFLMNLSQRKSAISSQGDLKRYLDEQDERTEHINELIQAQKRFTSVTDSSSPIPVLNSSSHTFPKNSFDSPFSQKNQSFNSSLNKSNASPFLSNQHANASNFEQKLNTQEMQHTLPAYKPAIKVSALPSSPEKSESVNFNHSSPKTLEKILTKFDIDDSRLNQMVENIRKWISQTILVRLSEEIDSINKLISEKGFIDSLIGETSIQQLRQLAITKKSDFSTLDQLCLFLDINIRNIENNSALQQYLVRRIKDLAKGGCITEFLWEGGGSYNYKHWKEDMLTDTEIILHLFCVYMDSRLLFNPTIPEGKPFTSQHLQLYSGTTPKSDTYIKQVNSYPPHYSLVLKSDNFDLPQGRNNLFYALLVFLHHIKVKNFGLLGRINLGSSGLNIAWVIDK